VERRGEGSGEGKHFGLGAGWGKRRRWDSGVDEGVNFGEVRIQFERKFRNMLVSREWMSIKIC
jgi:hypothetical protein